MALARPARPMPEKAMIFVAMTDISCRVRHPFTDRVSQGRPLLHLARRRIWKGVGQREGFGNLAVACRGICAAGRRNGAGDLAPRRRAGAFLALRPSRMVRLPPRTLRTLPMVHAVEVSTTGPKSPDARRRFRTWRTWLCNGARLRAIATDEQRLGVGSATWTNVKAERPARGRSWGASCRPVYARRARRSMISDMGGARRLSSECFSRGRHAARGQPGAARNSGGHRGIASR